MLNDKEKENSKEQELPIEMPQADTATAESDPPSAPPLPPDTQ